MISNSRQSHDLLAKLSSEFFAPDLERAVRIATLGSVFLLLGLTSVTGREGSGGRDVTSPALLNFRNNQKHIIKKKKNSTPILGGLATPQTLLLSRGPSSPGPPVLISLNMSFARHVTWKCILFTDLKTLEVFTIQGSESHGSVHYSRI